MPQRLAVNPRPSRQSVYTIEPPRRRIELGLLLLVSLATALAYLLALYGQHPSATLAFNPYIATIIVAPYLAHIANRKLAPLADPSFLPLASLLNGIGFVVIHRLDVAEGRLQVIWTIVGVTAYIATLLIVRSSDTLDRYRYLLVAGGVVLLFTPLIPHIGQNINGERLWIRVGPLSFQPVEAAKLLLAVFTASYLTDKQDLLRRFSLRNRSTRSVALRTFGPLGAAWALSLLVMTAERDIGFGLLLFTTFLTMLWIATANKVFVGFGLALFAVGFFVADKLFYQVNERITIWLDPWKYALSTGYQIVQGQYAFGSGGLTGTGLGLGHPTLIPVVTSDFIFAAIGEEMGLLGTTAILFAILLIVGAGFRTAVRARTEFSSLTAFSFTLIFALQTFFIIAGVTRVLPLTGVTLPFVAYGGSSLLANYVLIAILTRISHEGNVTYGPPMRSSPRATVPQTP
ncbi:MAG: FtsW/RodA/SpoVE family cell cycle protein [Acidimicrobiales bacterium]